MTSVMKNMMKEDDVDVEMYDPWVDTGEPPLGEKAVFFIGTNHDKFLDYKFPKGSIVIDPWRMMSKQDGVELISIGNSSNYMVGV